MTIFDMHCDTVQKITDYGGNIRKNNYHLDINRISKLDCNYIQFFAAFIDRKKDLLSPYMRCNQLIDSYFSEIAHADNMVSHCETVTDIKAALQSNKVASFLSIEGGEAIEGSIENLHTFYKKGVRAMTLTWNYSNELCGGIESDKNEGLTDFGKKVVSEMNHLGMLIDVSHISVKGFWDVIETTQKPIAATHSNCKKICQHKRNLDDEQIRAIINNNGCIGINLYSPFISEEEATIKNVLNHIEHILSLGGENNIGLGSDFDGMSQLPRGLEGVQDIHKLFDEMSKAGYTDLLIKKISSNNILNLMEKILL